MTSLDLRKTPNISLPYRPFGLLSYDFGLKLCCPFRISNMTDRKAVIKNADMSEDMQQDAVDCATQVVKDYIYD